MVDLRINWTLCTGAVSNCPYRAGDEGVYLFLGFTINNPRHKVKTDEKHLIYFSF